MLCDHLILSLVQPCIYFPEPWVATQWLKGMCWFCPNSNPYSMPTLQPLWLPVRIKFQFPTLGESIADPILCEMSLGSLEDPMRLSVSDLVPVSWTEDTLFERAR